MTPEIIGLASKSGPETTSKFGKDLFFLVFISSLTENCLNFKFGVDLISKFVLAHWDRAGFGYGLHRQNVADSCTNCNCNYISFTKLSWPGDSKGTFWSSSQAATYPPVYHRWWRLHIVPLIAKRQAGKL